MCFMTEKTLGQSRENSTDAVTVYTAGTGVTGIVKNMMLTNTTSSPISASVFLDNDGSTYDESTAIMWDSPIQANGNVHLACFFPLSSGGTLGYKSSVANGLTITVGGAEIS